MEVRNAVRALLCAPLCFALSCNYVPLTEGGGRVAVATPAAVAECLQLGRTTSKTTSKVWIFPRSDETVRHELESLARNEGSKIGGTAIAPMGKMTDGEQVFGIYRCIPARGTSAPAGG